MELLIVSIICGLLLAISLGKMVYWRGQATFYRMMRDAAMEHADGLSKQVRKQSDYIKKLHAERDEAILRAQGVFVPVSDSAKHAQEG